MFNILESFVDRGTGRSHHIVIAAAFTMAALAIFCLGGCAQLGQITAQDAETAAKVAAAVGDTAGEQCWPVLATTGNAIAATGNSTGILTLIEEKRAFKAALETPTCQPVWAGVLAEVLKLTPVAPLVP